MTDPESNSAEAPSRRRRLRLISISAGAVVVVAASAWLMFALHNSSHIEHGVAIAASDSSIATTTTPAMAPPTSVTSTDVAASPLSKTKVTRPAVTTPPVTELAVPTTTAMALPAGYPKVQSVSTLPAQVKNWYQTQGVTQAVEVYPGVWAPMHPGASVDDSVAAGVFDGFCASIKAYENQFLDGQDAPGACW